MALQPKPTSQSAKTKGDVGFTLDGSSASRAIPPGESQPGWDTAPSGTQVVHSEVKPYA